MKLTHLITAACVTAIGFSSVAHAANIDTLRSKLRAEFDGQFIGYSFAIAKGGKVRRAYSAGWARRPGDGNKEMNASTRVNIASVSKNLTAIAVLQLLAKNKMSIEHKIAPYLPKGWKRGPGFRNKDSLTFRQLLPHTSGINQKIASLPEAKKKKMGNDWDGLKYLVKLGVQKKYLGQGKYSAGNYSYKNANYALFRLIVPALWMKSKGASWDHVNKASHGPMFMLYVGEKIFKPAGVKGASCRQEKGRLDAAGYDWTKPKEKGSRWDVSQTGCGAHGHWHLSMRQLAKVASLANCENHKKVPGSKRLLSKSLCFARDVRKLGWNKNSNGSSARYKGIYWHGGDLFSRKAKPRRALHSCLMKFPGGVDVAAVVTSDSRDGESVCGKVLDAYHAS